MSTQIKMNLITLEETYMYTLHVTIIAIWVILKAMNCILGSLNVTGVQTRQLEWPVEVLAQCTHTHLYNVPEWSEVIPLCSEDLVNHIGTLQRPVSEQHWSHIRLYGVFVVCVIPVIRKCNKKCFVCLLFRMKWYNLQQWHQTTQYLS